jgi:hypothetical protein
MQIQKVVRGALAFGLLCAAAGQALGAQVLYDSIDLVSGQQTVTDSFALAGPGTLTVSLQDMQFPAPFASLDLMVSNSTALLGPETGAGTESFQITGPQQIYVQALATAEGPLGTGVFGLDVMWKPTTPVPLATSIAFLGSGLLLLAWQRRQRREQEPGTA